MISAGIGAAGSLASGFMSSSASNNAAKTQAQAAQNSLAMQQQMFATGQSNIQPYLATGSNASNMLTNALPGLSQNIPTPATMTQSQLEQTPGYQFNLSQGLKSVQNSASARGLGVSGAAQKGAASYATGLADSTYQNQFNNEQTQFTDAQTNRQNLFNNLYSTAALGANSASGAATNATNSGNAMASTTMTGANGQAASQIASGTAFNNSLNNLGGYYQMAQMGGMYGNNGAGTSSLTGTFNGG